VVFLNSLKDTRPTAPKMSYGSGRANLGSLRTLSRSENFNRTSLSDVVGHFCLYGIRPLKIFSAASRYRTQVCVNAASESRFYAQET
jgi:hypothetical protein